MRIRNHLKPALALLAALMLSTSSAFELFGSGSIYSPELGRDINVQKKSDSKEYAIDYSDLSDPGLTIAAGDTSKCEDWRKAIVKSGDGTLPASFYNKARAHMKLRVLNLGPLASVAHAIGSGWTNAGDFAISKVTFNYKWESDALSVLAGPKVTLAIQREVENLINSFAAHNAIKETGAVEFDIANILLVCDLMQERVTLGLTAAGTRYSVFHYPSVVRPSDLVEVSKNVVASAGSLKENGIVYGQDSSRVINSAGLLGYQLHKQGYGADIFRSGSFMKIFSKVFTRGPTEPSELTSDEAGDLVRTLATTKSSSKDFNISQSLTVKTE